ncbi:hypothetical protein NC652_029655 [Populus alba x Populus x berolinensis]|nr:hypothetical protein NC652_029655 [Populus alba x Populus x berolinensis]
MGGLKKGEEACRSAMPWQEDQSCHPLQLTACHCNMWALSCQPHLIIKIA